MDGELIVVALISTMGMVVTIQLLQHNWYKKENFRVKIKNINAENRIKLKKLERELGLKGETRAAAADSKSPLDNLGGLLSIAKELEPDQLRAVIDMFTSGELGGEGGEYSELMPLVKGFLEGMNKPQEETPKKELF